jgi:hypothetical protein
MHLIHFHQRWNCDTGITALADPKFVGDERCQSEASAITSLSAWLENGLEKIENRTSLRNIYVRVTDGINLDWFCRWESCEASSEARK